MKNIKYSIIVIFISLISGCDLHIDNNLEESDIGVDFSRISTSKKSATSIELSGSVHNNNQNLSYAGVCVDTEREFTRLDADIIQEISGATISSPNAINVSTQILNLRANTQYYAKFYAQISDNISYSETISFKTSPLSPDGGSVKYDLPIVFHILYTDASDRNKNIPTQTLQTIVDSCNKMFNNSYKDQIGMNTGIQLSFTSSDNQGVTLDTPGVDRIQVSSSTYKLEDFGRLRSTVNQMWNPNKVINIWIYTFDDNNKNVVGQSYVAYGTELKPIAGLNNGDAYLTELPAYGHGVQMSNRYIQDLDVFSEALTHEIGHYLGLFHTFSNKGCDVKNDYCDDTPTYDRDKYSTQLDHLYRKDCLTGKVYKATNFMDYYIADLQLFTRNQIDRMHYVLTNSPLVPGASIRQKTKSSQGDAPLPKERLM